jgi:hypothetical protein
MMLATPKQKFEPPNIFMVSDFRGMIHADQEDAIKNTNLENTQSVRQVYSRSTIKSNMTNRAGSIGKKYS